MFPENSIPAPDWKSTNMVERTIEYLQELPPPQKRLLLLLFLFVEFAAPVLLLCLSRFSKLSVKRRTDAIRAWRRSAFFPFRLLGDAIKATTTMMYVSHPLVLEHIGEYRVCDSPDDPLQIETRADALSKMQESA